MIEVLNIDEAFKLWAQKLPEIVHTDYKSDSIFLFLKDKVEAPMLRH